METTLQKKASLHSTIGRPKKGCLSSFSTIVRERILSIREAHSGWGARSIWTEMHSDKSLRNLSIPKPSTIALFLKHKGLVKKYERNVPLPNSQLHPATYACLLYTSPSPRDRG